jgi:hypothetical protein
MGIDPVTQDTPEDDIHGGRFDVACGLMEVAPKQLDLGQWLQQGCYIATMEQLENAIKASLFQNSVQSHFHTSFAMQTCLTVL